MFLLVLCEPLWLFQDTKASSGLLKQVPLGQGASEQQWWSVPPYHHTPCNVMGAVVRKSFIASPPSFLKKVKSKVPVQMTLHVTGVVSVCHHVTKGLEHEVERGTCVSWCFLTEATWLSFFTCVTLLMKRRTFVFHNLNCSSVKLIISRFTRSRWPLKD